MIDLDLQIASAAPGIPSEDAFRAWVHAALAGRRAEAELTIRVVDEEESAELNGTYRHQPGPTNVLSFPFAAPPGVTLPLLGDIVICAPVVAREAREQGKTAAAHWAHMTVHGCLHLLGHDHIDPAEAEIMEALERDVLSALGYADPYA
ncbi:MAG: rRNA maturation RNase YbeY [Thiohalomonadaceae bacterium]